MTKPRVLYTYGLLLTSFAATVLLMLHFSGILPGADPESLAPFVAIPLVLYFLT